jgi:hypothetical protein
MPVREKVMVAMNMLVAAAGKEPAKQAMLKRLRESGATSPAMPGSLDSDDEHSQSALAQMLEAGTLREARPGLSFIDEETAKKEPRPGNGFIALLALLVAISFAALIVAIASTAG